MGVMVALDFFGSGDDDINRRVGAAEAAPDGRRQAPAVELSFFDDQQIQITMRPHVATCGRSEQDDPLRRCGLDDTMNDVGQNFGVGSAVGPWACLRRASHGTLPA
jgi:hypothetical protein